MHHGEDLVEHRTREASFYFAFIQCSYGRHFKLCLAAALLRTGGRRLCTVCVGDGDIANSAEGLGFDTRIDQTANGPPRLSYFFRAALRYFFSAVGDGPRLWLHGGIMKICMIPRV